MFSFQVVSFSLLASLFLDFIYNVLYAPSLFNDSQSSNKILDYVCALENPVCSPTLSFFHEKKIFLKYKTFSGWRYKLPILINESIWLTFKFVCVFLLFLFHKPGNNPFYSHHLINLVVIIFISAFILFS